MRSRVRAAVLALVVICAFGASATVARAGLLDGLGSVLDQILGGGTEVDPDLGGELADLLCAPTTDLAEAIENGALSALPADVIPALTCNLDLLDYKFQTTFKRANGTEVVRTHNALVQVPRLLNVDDDILPDLVGTIGLSGAGRFTLRVNRMLGENATLPTKVEAIVSAPSGVDIGRDTIAFGYDTTTSSAPKTFNSGISLLSLIGPGGPGIKFATDVTGAGPSLALIGELYDKGPAGERRNPLRARVGFTPVPANLTATVDLGNPVVATVTTSQRSKVDVLGQLISTPANGPSTEKRIDAVIDTLPSTVTVSYLSEGEFQRTITYDAGQRIGRIDVTYTEKIGTVIDQKAVVTVKDLPRGLVVHQTGKVDADMTTTQGPIGEVYGAFANGEPQAAPAAPGVNVITEGDYSSTGFRAGGIEALDVHGAAPYTLDATLARQKFGVLIDDRDKNRTINALITSLPHKLHLELDPDGGHVVFDGFGEAIGEITLDADDDDPFFAEATEITGAIRGLPAFLDLHFAQEKGGGVSFSANQGPAEVEILASDGATATLPAGESGVVYRDTEEEYLVFARIFGLRAVSVDPDPLLATVETAGGHVFTANALLAKPGDEKRATARIADLPRVVRVGYEETGRESRRVTYAASAPIRRIDVEYRDLAVREDGSSALEQTAVLGIDDLPGGGIDDEPSALVVEQLSKDALTLEARDPVTRIEGGFATLGEVEPVDGSEPGARIVTSGEERPFSAAVRIEGLVSAAFTGGDVPHVVTKFARPQTFAVSFEDRALNRFVSGRIADLPTGIDLTLDPDRVHVLYDASDEIREIAIEATDDDPFFERATRIEGTLRELPAHVDLTLDQDSDEVILRTDQGIGEIELLATSGIEKRLDDGQAGVIYLDTVDDYQIFARVFGLEQVVVDPDPLHAVVETTSGGDFTVEARLETVDPRFLTLNDVKTIDAQLTGLPERIEVDYVEGDAPDERHIAYNGRGSLDGIDLTYTDLDPVRDKIDTKVLFNVTGLPDALTVDQTGPTAATLSASAPVTSIEGAIANGEPLLPEGDTPGFRLRTTGDPDAFDHFSSIGFRIDGLEAATLDGEAPYMIEATLAPTPFNALIEDPDAGRTITANLDGLPHHFKVQFDPESGGVPIKGITDDRTMADYDGFGQEIGSVDLIAVDNRVAGEAADEDGFGSQIRRLEAFVDGIPDHVAVDFVIAKPEEEPQGQESTEIKFTADGGVDSMEALAIAGIPTARTRDRLVPSDQQFPFPADQSALIQDPTRAGVVFNDTGPIVAFARIFGLSEVEVTTDPLHVHTSASAAQKLDVLVRDEDDEDATTSPLVSTIDASVDPLPADLTLDVTPGPTTGETVIDYSASSPIDEIEVETHNIGDIEQVSDLVRFGKVSMRATLRGVPRDVDVFLGGPDCVTSLTTGCGNVVDVDLANGEEPAALDFFEAQVVEEGQPFESTANNDVAIFRETGDLPFVVAAKLHGFANLDVTTAPTLTNVDFDTFDARRFVYELQQLDSTANNGPTAYPLISGAVDKPQGNTHVILRPISNATTIDYGAAGPIEQVDLLQGYRRDGATNPKVLLDVELRGLPSNVDACIGQPSSCEGAGFRTSGIGESHNVDAFGAFFQSNAPDFGNPDERIALDAYACLKEANPGCDGDITLTDVRFSQLAFEVLGNRDGYLFADTFGTLVTGTAVARLAKPADPGESFTLTATLGGGMRVDRRMLDLGASVPGFDGADQAFCAQNLDIEASPLFGGGEAIEALFCTDRLP